MSEQSLSVTTPTDLSIVMTRRFAARRELVWDAMVKPELLRRWMFTPEGWEMSVCEMDARTGGSFRWVWNTASGELAMTITGDYREITPPTRIVHTELMEMGPGTGSCGGGESGEGDEAAPWELLATLELLEQAGGTKLRMTLEFPTREARDVALQSGMEHGMEIGYARLDGIFSEVSGG